MLMNIGLIFCTSDIKQNICGMSAQLSAQGAFVGFVVGLHIVCFVVHIVCSVIHVVCQVDVIAYSLL